MPASLGAAWPCATLASSDRAPKLMSETKTGISSRSGRSASGPMTTAVSTASSSSSGRRASCAGDELDRVPGRESVARHSHRRDLAVMADRLQPVAAQLLDAPHVGLVGGAVRVGVHTEIGVTVVGLGMLACPIADLVAVDDHRSVLDPRAESVQALAVVVRADAGAEAVVQPWTPHKQVLVDDGAVGHEGATVEASAVEHRHLVVEADDHEVHVAHERADRLTVGYLGPAGDLDGCHGSILPDITCRSGTLGPVGVFRWGGRVLRQRRGPVAPSARRVSVRSIAGRGGRGRLGPMGGRAGGRQCGG